MQDFLTLARAFLGWDPDWAGGSPIKARAALKAGRTRREQRILQLLREIVHIDRILALWSNPTAVAQASQAVPDRTTGGGGE